jgi:hypothetical protein
MSKARVVDPTYENSRKEAIGIGLIWLACTVYCCAYSYFFGYNVDGMAKTVDDVHPIWGIPSWVFWGVMAPWAVCTVINIWYAGFYMADDDLGRDHSIELNEDIREGGPHE